MHALFFLLRTNSLFCLTEVELLHHDYFYFCNCTFYHLINLFCQLFFRALNHMQQRLCNRMLCHKNGTAVLKWQNRSLIGANFLGKGNDIFLIKTKDLEPEEKGISLEDVAAEKMNILTFLMKSLSGGAVDLATNANETMTADGQTYALVTDERFAINSLGKAAFERLLEETVTGAEYTRWKGILDESFRVSEPDGSSYILTSNAHGYQSFETGSGVTITDQTDTSFTATTKDANQIDGRGVAHFVFDGINWTIESYEFQ